MRVAWRAARLFSWPAFWTCWRCSCTMATLRVSLIWAEGEWRWQLWSSYRQMSSRMSATLTILNSYQLGLVLTSCLSSIWVRWVKKYFRSSCMRLPCSQLSRPQHSPSSSTSRRHTQPTSTSISSAPQGDSLRQKWWKRLSQVCWRGANCSSSCESTFMVPLFLCSTSSMASPMARPWVCSSCSNCCRLLLRRSTSLRQWQRVLLKVLKMGWQQSFSFIFALICSTLLLQGSSSPMIWQCSRHTWQACAVSFFSCSLLWEQVSMMTGSSQRHTCTCTASLLINSYCLWGGWALSCLKKLISFLRAASRSSLGWTWGWWGMPCLSMSPAISSSTFWRQSATWGWLEFSIWLHCWQRLSSCFLSVFSTRPVRSILRWATTQPWWRALTALTCPMWVWCCPVVCLNCLRDVMKRAFCRQQQCMLVSALTRTKLLRLASQTLMLWVAAASFSLVSRCISYGSTACPSRVTLRMSPLISSLCWAISSISSPISIKLSSTTSYLWNSSSATLQQVPTYSSIQQCTSSSWNSIRQCTDTSLSWESSSPSRSICISKLSSRPNRLLSSMLLSLSCSVSRTRTDVEASSARRQCSSSVSSSLERGNDSFWFLGSQLARLAPRKYLAIRFWRVLASLRRVNSRLRVSLNSSTQPSYSEDSSFWSLQSWCRASSSSASLSLAVRQRCWQSCLAWRKPWMLAVRSWAVWMRSSARRASSERGMTLTARSRSKEGSSMRQSPKIATLYSAMLVQVMDNITTWPMAKQRC